jgi:hypothetical protein
MNKDFENTLNAYDAEHDRVWSNLPWFVNQSLAAEEHDEAKTHLSTCLVCRREVVGLNALQEAISTRRSDPKCESALDRLHERLDGSESHTREFPWAAAAVLVIVTGLAGIINLNSGLTGDPIGTNAYSTLGARSIEMIDENIVTARIVFDQDITELQLRELLLSAQVELIDGPTPRGAYTIVLPDVRRGADLQSAVGKLRGSKRVLFVEPIVGIGPQD